MGRWAGNYKNWDWVIRIKSQVPSHVLTGYFQQVVVLDMCWNNVDYSNHRPTSNVWMEISTSHYCIQLVHLYQTHLFWNDTNWICCIFLSLQLTLEEQQRRRVRRERNKMAAAKCRNRRKELTDTLQIVSSSPSEKNCHNGIFSVVKPMWF